MAKKHWLQHTSIKQTYFFLRTCSIIVIGNSVWLLYVDLNLQFEVTRY